MATVTLGDVIALLIASDRGTHTVEQRLDALVNVLEAAENDRLDHDALEVLFESGLSRDDRRALTVQIQYHSITLQQVHEAVDAAKSHLRSREPKAS